MRMLMIRALDGGERWRSGRTEADMTEDDSLISPRAGRSCSKVVAELEASAKDIL